jgi:hypothetical protein
MSETSSDLGYEPLLSNPSESLPFPVVFSAVFENGGDLAYYGEHTYEGLIGLRKLERSLRLQFPNLYDEAAALIAVESLNADTLISQFNNDTIETSMEYYYRGVTLALAALISSAPEGSFKDLTVSYSTMLEATGMIEKEQWLMNVRAAAQTRVWPVLEFIDRSQLGESHDTPQNKALMKTGAEHGYLLLAHSRACIEREKELAWMARDEEYVQAWLDYHSANY